MLLTQQSLKEEYYVLLFQAKIHERYGHLLDESMTQLLMLYFVNIMSNKDVQEKMIELKEYDETSYIHSFDVMMLVGIVSILTETYDLYLLRGSLMHDIGKLEVPIDILQKKKKLSREEFERVKKHTVHGSKTLKSFGFDKEAELARSHHERIDGTGYPDGVLGLKLNIQIRLLGIVDVYSALTLERPYKKQLSNKQALDIIKKDKEKYDINLIEMFEEIINSDKQKSANK